MVAIGRARQRSPLFFCVSVSADGELYRLALSFQDGRESRSLTVEGSHCL